MTIQKHAVKHTAARVCPVSFPAEGSSALKSPRSKLVSAHCCCFWNHLTCLSPLSVRWVTSPSIKNCFSRGTPNSFPPKTFTKPLLWGFRVPCNADLIAETGNSLGWLKHVLVFSHFWQRRARVFRKEKKHKGALHLSGRNLYHLHHVSLVLHQHLRAVTSPCMCSNHVTSNRQGSTPLLPGLNAQAVLQWPFKITLGEEILR